MALAHLVKLILMILVIQLLIGKIDYIFVYTPWIIPHFAFKIFQV